MASDNHNSLKSRLSGTSLSSLFHLSKKRRHSDDEGDANSETDSQVSTDHRESTPIQIVKRRHLAEEEESKKFAEEEKQRDAELPSELRKYRPRGFNFNLPPKGRPIRVYADGVFDLFHLGHMKQLEQCKKSLPNVVLICGVPSDTVTHKLKGLTVLTDKQRCESLQHCKWVDEVIPNAPWCVTPEFLAEHKIDYVAHDDLPYGSADSDDIYRPIKEKGQFLTTQRTDGISTSDIITKIIKDYDKYLMRNFARGATRQELNVSWLKKNELDFKKHVNDFRSYFKKNQENLNHASKDLYFEVREILLRKTLGHKLYSKLTGDGTRQLQDSLSRTRRFIREKSPVSDFASRFTGEGIPDSNWTEREENDGGNENRPSHENEKEEGEAEKSEKVPRKRSKKNQQKKAKR
ncbi:PCT1 (YGR202C) [Zygosaccharomyces parabailii]|uniref:choline-phosphate cytidylyltransferase n=1 Tax=Zygosaccharomyces bailii (strain CLIB 213 / ATCC 58445 / CBS 680 / BCRC 21525 / NBRC 1098 / NCYC 1416 / NRRL Y-2227) TaxID=1333698 RepID=A0A8J2T2K6_ZYGB2|nr:PCT1 (YGR202C) [Zygosaccharomyces parabailii]CDF87473.1 BN860_07162g1_1 [Zygosaccharomyces bailii CLIB 213]CDH09379.1 related to Choline-phosphate cytidylyltransferase [Zygosaccharomyces bailii ISA1307]